MTTPKNARKCQQLGKGEEAGAVRGGEVTQRRQEEVRLLLWCVEGAQEVRATCQQINNRRKSHKNLKG